MKYKALISFAGSFSMNINDIKEISDKKLISDLINAGYIEEVKETAKNKESEKSK